MTRMRAIDCPPAACRRVCGAGLAGEPVTALRRHQVTDIEPPPEPKVTATAKDARRLARRFRTFEDLILRFATRLDVDSGSWLASVVRDRAVTGRPCRARGMVELADHRVQEAADHRRGTAAHDHLVETGGQLAQAVASMPPSETGP